MSDFKDGVEIERKYIIEMPSEREMAAMEGYSADMIEQSYLEAADGVTHRVRRRESNGSVRYYETVKIRIDGMSAHEREREIDGAQYDRLLENKARGTKTLFKTRHSFVYLGQLMEVDVYPEWSRTAILETELPSREGRAEMPKLIRVIREVTGERGYSNAAMARHFPPEEKI